MKQIAIPLLVAANFMSALVAYDSIRSKAELRRELKERIREIKEENDYLIEGKNAKIRVLEGKLEQIKVRPRMTNYTSSTRTP